MIDATKLRYFTMASWLRGYAAGLDLEQHPTLAYKLNKAADMLDKVWNDYLETEKNDDPI